MRFLRTESKDFRRSDFLEHRSLEAAAVEKYYRPEWAEMVFDFAWRTMAELLPSLHRGLLFSDTFHSTNTRIRA
jgi:hypothetical protein